MTNNERNEVDHLSKAKDYIAIAESEDSKREAYEKAADEIIAWLAEDKTRSRQQAADAIGKKLSWLEKFLTWGRSPYRDTDLPFGGERQQGVRDNYTVRKVLREASPEKIDELMDDPRIAGRLHSAVDRDRAKPLPPMSDNTPREPLHWMLTKLASLYHDHDRFLREEGERCIALPAELRLAAAMVIETGERKMAKFKEALEAEDADVRAILLAEAMDARREMDKALDKILGGAA